MSRATKREQIHKIQKEILMTVKRTKNALST